eukprot:scaffold10301_cov121-Isochrysis_galbana.AAC.7
MVVLRLCGSSQRGAQLSTDLRQRPAGSPASLEHLAWLFAHHVALRWVTRAFRRRRDSHVDVVRLRGRRSGARISGRLLHAKPKIGVAPVDSIVLLFTHVPRRVPRCRGPHAPASPIRVAWACLRPCCPPAPRGTAGSPSAHHLSRTAQNGRRRQARPTFGTPPTGGPLNSLRRATRALGPSPPE